MKQNIPRSAPGLVSASAQAIGGLTLYGAGIGVLLNTSVAIGADRAALILADNLYEAAKDELAARQLILDGAMREASEFVTYCRELLKPSLGKRHSQVWDGTGFRNSLRVPTKPEVMLPLTVSMEAFLTSHVSVHNTELDINPAAAQTVGQTLSNAINAVNAQETEVERLLGERDAAARKVRLRLTGLVAEAKQLIPGLDSRWLALGLNRPGARERPDAPTNVAVTSTGTNTVAVKWDKAPRAEYYRIWAKVNGVSLEFVVVGSAVDRNFTIEGLPGNALVEIAVSALNNGGESVKSTVVTVSTQ